MKCSALLTRTGVSVLGLSLVLSGCGAPAPKDAPNHTATNEYHGVKVTDEYRWLENNSDPAVREWSAAQNDRARSHLDKLTARQLIADRLTRLFSQASADYSFPCWRRETLFLLKSESDAAAVLVTLTSVTNLASEKTILDPNNLNGNGALSIDWYEPSPDGRQVAVSLSQNGSHRGVLHIYDTRTGEPLPDVIPGVHAPIAGGSAAWLADGSSLLYTRYPKKGERPAGDLDYYPQIYLHQLGTSADEDKLELGKEFSQSSGIRLKASPDNRWFIASVASGGSDFRAQYLRDPSGRWRQVAGLEDEIRLAEFGHDPLYVEWGKDDGIYLLSRKDAPKGKILRVPLSQPNLTNAATILPEGTHVLQNFKPAASGLGLVYLKGGPCEFAYYDFFDKIVRGSPEKTPTAIEDMVVTQGDEILFRSVSYTEPYRWHRYDSSRNKSLVDETSLAGRIPVSFTDAEVIREMVTSTDGTKVPLNIIRKRGTRLQADNPTILTGYGGAGLSATPEFDLARRVWLDHGGIVAVANLRGGDEFGEGWKRAGALTNKQNAFDDFIACAEFLVRSNYTSAAKLAIEGQSQSGLLMGAMLAQRPALLCAVVSDGGIYDPLRAELEPLGVVRAADLGSVANPDQFTALYAYSPYHHLSTQTNLPAVLLSTDESDPLASPGQSRKMAARLQKAASSPRPILLLTQRQTGQGLRPGLSQRVQELADVYAFLFEQLGLDFSVIDRGPWSGGITPTSAVIKAKLVREDLNARLVMSKELGLAQPRYTQLDRSETNHGNVVQFVMEDLEPDTQYYYALEIEGRLDRKKAGALRTFPRPAPASFTIAFAGDARTGSTSEVFDRIREHRPLFFLNPGDFHYLDIQTNSRARFRAGYDAVLASPQQAELYRQIPFVYVWDDHDFTGNNSNRKAPAHEAAQLTYDEYVPHYPLPLAPRGAEGPICQSFSVGRVKFIVTDLRSARDDVRKKDTADKSMMGARQKAWFKKELLEARGKYPLICWVSSTPWIGQAGTNYYHAVRTDQYGFIQSANLAPRDVGGTNRYVTSGAEEHWSVYSAERREIADFIKQHAIRGICILHADAHMLAADDGRHSDYATGGGAPIPVMCAAPLDQEPSLKGGPYSQGIYRVRPGEGCFGLFTVADHGDVLDVTFSGRNQRDEEKISLRFSVPAPRGMAKN